MKKKLCAVMAIAILLCTHIVVAQTGNASAPIEVHAAEALRRGNAVRIVGEGPRGAAEDAIVAATAPPPDDSHMWYVTIFLDDSQASKQVRADFAKSQQLLAFVSAPESGKAWAHLNVYDVSDQTQADRIKRYKLRDERGALRTPVIVVQPPRNGMWGDPRTVVTQLSGYDGDPAKLAKQITEGVKLFAAKAAEHGYPKVIVSHYHSNQGARQEVTDRNAAPPFSAPAPVNPFAPQPQPFNPSPWPDGNPNIPNNFPPQPAPTINPLSGLSGLLTSPWIAILVVFGLQIAQMYTKRTPSTVDDQIVATVTSVLETMGIFKPQQEIKQAVREVKSA